MPATESTKLSGATGLCQWEKPSSAACSGIVRFVNFFDQLRTGGAPAALWETEGEADKVTFPLSPEEYQELLELLVTVTTDQKNHDALNAPSTVRQEQLQKLQLQLQQQQQQQQHQNRQVSLQELDDLISYIGTQVRLPGHLNGTVTVWYSQTLGLLEVESPNQSKIYQRFKTDAGSTFANGIHATLQELLPDCIYDTEMSIGYSMEMPDGESFVVDVLVYLRRKGVEPTSKKVPVLVIEVNTTHTTGHKKMLAIGKYCRKQLGSDVVLIVRLDVETRMVSERRKNPDKPYRVSADLFADLGSGPMNVYRNQVICAGGGHGNDGEVGFLMIPLEFIHYPTLKGVFASIPCEELRSAFAKAVEMQNAADRGVHEAEADGAGMTALQK